MDWPTRVSVSSGVLEGYRVESTNYFLGVPYATPPTGNLRWRPPQPVSTWNGVRPAKEFSSVCMQDLSQGSKDSYTFPQNVTASEDCLYLNIWAPAQSQGLLPVMLWIHGGGLVGGGNPEFRERGQNMSTLGNVLVVLINYRLGILGFLAHPLFATEDSSHPTTGNYGFLDQRMSMQWVKQNIAQFGGDPNNINIFGESAGGTSVAMHMVLPKSKGLFAKVLMESAATFHETEPLKDQNAKAVQLQTQLGCQGNNQQILACLRQTSADKLVSLVGQYPPYAVVDHYELLEHPYRTFVQSKNFTSVPLLAGNVYNEGSFAAGSTPLTPDQYKTIIQNGYSQFYVQILNEYPCEAYNISDCRVALSFVVGDSSLVCPGLLAANANANAGSTTYGYVFAHHPYYNDNPFLGAYHSSEIEFVFSTLASFRKYQPDEVVLSNIMTKYWTSFGTSGNPNSNNNNINNMINRRNSAPTPIPWPQYQYPMFSRVMLDLELSTTDTYKQSQCKFWESIYDIIFNY